MNKKTIGLGVASLSLGVMLLVPTANAFFGGRGGGQERTPEMFAEMQQMVQSASSWEDLEAAREAQREARQALVSHEVEKIDNGVIVTITTDDVDALARIQNRPETPGNGQGQNRENISRSVETLSNGVRITITTDDADTLQRLHDRADAGWNTGRPNGRGRGGMRGEGRGQGEGERMERGEGKGRGGRGQM